MIGPRLDVEVVEDAGAFAALEAEWEDLRLSCPRATPFQSWAWLYSWWEHYGAGRALRLVAVRDRAAGGLLVGLVPLMLERGRWGLGRLLFVGTGQTDYFDMLAREGWEREVSEAAAGALRGLLGGWAVADLQQLRPEAAAWGLFRKWTGRRAFAWQEGCPVIDVKPWDELVASLSKNHRSTLRRALRRAEADGVTRRMVGPEGAGEAASRLVALHRELWQGRDMVPEHSTQRWASFIEVAALRVITYGLGEITEFRRNGEVIVTLFWVFGQDFVAFYHSGANREALERYQWSSLLIRAGIDIAREQNSACLDLLRGEESYKLRWASRVIPSYRMILSRNPVLWAPYTAYHVSRSRAKRYVNSESSPQWTKNAAGRLKKITGL